MSIQIVMTRAEVRRMKGFLKKKVDFVCMDKLTFVKANLVALSMALDGAEVNAKIIKGDFK